MEWGLKNLGPGPADDAGLERQLVTACLHVFGHPLAGPLCGHLTTRSDWHRVHGTA